MDQGTGAVCFLTEEESPLANAIFEAAEHARQFGDGQTAIRLLEILRDLLEAE